MLQIKHVTKYYVRSKPVISDMNVTFGNVGLNVIVGKSGCGKTTLLNLIGTMDQDYIGSIEYNGIEISTLPYNKMSDYRNYDTAFIFQINSLFEHLTVRENIQLVLDLQSKQVDIASILEKVGLVGFEDKKVKALSGGERQRVGIARALAKDSKIILADEPTSALDSKNAHKILALLKEVSKDKLVIVVTHDTKKAVQYADRMIKLVDGRIVEDMIYNEVEGAVTQIQKKPAKKHVLLPIFWYQLRKTLFINLFIVLLVSFALAVASVAAEQKAIRTEYDLVERDIPFEFNPLRTLTTHVGNQIDYYNVVKATETDKTYTYLQTLSDRVGGLNQSDVNTLTQYFRNYNIYLNYSETGNLIIDGISQVLKQSQSYQGLVYYWNEPQRSQFQYYQYREDNTYDLAYGRLPVEDHEILITDTVADSYLNRNELDASDLSVMLGEELTVRDIYHKISGYYYTVETPFTVVGIINTNQLQYFYYNNNSKTYNILDAIVQQSRFDIYMNPAISQPHGYIVTRNHLDAAINVKYGFTNLVADNIYYTNVALTNKNIATFHGVDDYRGILTREDNLTIDYNNRILLADPTGDVLEGNQILVTRDFLRILFPDLDLTTQAKVISQFFTDINGAEKTISFDLLQGTKEITFEIIGVANNTSSTFMYVSQEMFNLLGAYDAPPAYPSVMVGLEGTTATERMQLMETLYHMGYVLNPINRLPGAYLEFVENQGLIELIDDEGFSEIVNMSVYHLFSTYYNTDSMNEINSVLEIIQSIASFCIIMALVISIGFIYLKERRQRDYTRRLTAIGVRIKQVFLMNTINYLIMGLFIGILSYFLTKMAIDLINNNFLLELVDIGKVGIIARFRVIMTAQTMQIAFVAMIIALIVGITSTAIITYGSKK